MNSMLKLPFYSGSKLFFSPRVHSACHPTQSHGTGFGYQDDLLLD